MGALQLETCFAGRGMPVWLRTFEQDTEKALETLLVGGADLEHLQVAEPVDLLLGWLRFLTESGFPDALDGALAAWIRRRWGYPVLPALGASAALTATAWLRAMELIGQAEELSESARQLRQYFPADRPFLRAMSEGPSRDPEGRAWLALARHQSDDSLRESWWALCSLPPDVPWYHGEYGIDGLRDLFPPGARGIPPPVAEGLLRLADGLAGRVEDGWLNEGDARAEFLRVARSTSRAYPFPERWTAVWRSSGLKCRQELAKRWAGSLLPPGASRTQSIHLPPWMFRSDPGWSQRAGEIARLFDSHTPGALDQARRLIQEQADYARATGDHYYVARSLCRFADKVLKERPGLAVEWAAMARDFDFWDTYGWNTGIKALIAANHPSPALRLAMQAIGYFPENVVVRNVAADVLVKLGRFEEAESLYRETVARFPTNEVARNGLADVLKRQGRLEEAERFYRETVIDFPTNDVARNGLAGVLLSQRRWRDAEGFLLKTARMFPADVVSRLGLAFCARAERRWDEAEERYRAVLERDPQNKSATAALAFIEKRRQTAVSEVDTAVGLPEDQAEVIDLFETDYLEPALQAAAEEPEEVAVTEARDATGLTAPSVQDRQTAPEDHRGLRRQDIQVLILDSRLLRRWARPRREEQVGRLAESARRLLEKLAGQEEWSALAASEGGLLRLEESEYDAALSLLREAARRFPGSARVRYTLARAEREAARQQRRSFDETAAREVVRAWQGLVHLDERLVPLQWLGLGRAWLALEDGHRVRDQARINFGQLGDWIGRTRDRQKRGATGTDRKFTNWWAGEVERYLFGGEAARSFEELADIQPLEANIDIHRLILDDLEESWVARLAIT